MFYERFPLQEWTRSRWSGHRIFLVKNSFCVDTHAGMARAHLLSAWFNANGKRGKSRSHLLLPAFKSPPCSCQRQFLG
jgi:hypothetical protein